MRALAAATLIAGAAGTAAAAAEGAALGSGWPWSGVMALAVAAGIVAGGVAYWRRRRAGARERTVLAAAFARCAGAAMVSNRDGQPLSVTRPWRELVGGDADGPLAGMANGFFDDVVAGSEIARLHDAACRGHTAETTLAVAGPSDRRCRLVAEALDTDQGTDQGHVLWRLAPGEETPMPAPAADEAALDELSTFLGAAAIAFGGIDADGRLGFANPTLAGWLGIAPGTIAEPARPALDAVFEDVPGEGAGTIRLRTAEGATIEAEYLRSGALDIGGMAAVLAMRQPAAEASGAAPGAVPGVAVDGFQALFDPVPAGMALLDGAGRVLAGNRAVFRLIARDPHEILGASLAGGLAAPDRARYERWIAAAIAGGGPLVPLEVGIAEREGGLCLFAGRLPGHLPGPGAAGDDDPAPRLVVYLEPRGEQRGVDEQLFQSQKMELIGQLAGGIAHDFNNLLQAMIGFCDLLLQRHSPKDQSFADIMQIKQNANRAANLVRQLLAFSRQQTLQPKVLNLTDVLAELSNLLRRLIGANIELKMIHGRDLGLIKVDLGQFEQVVINLAVNARDAMTEGGVLSIATCDVASGDPRIAEFADLPDRDYVMLKIADSGCGIAKEHLDKIYEPFFTTKGVGAGTGLGLATVYGIINQTGGHIFVESAEDEDAVRLFGARALRNKGYNVIEARDGEHAVEVLDDTGEQVDLLISDVMMPGLDGPGLLRRVRESHPDLKVIFISGYTEDTFRERIDDGTVVHFLPKPFSLQDLAGKVKEVMQPSGA